MKNKLFLYILSFLGFIAFSCNDEIFIDNSETVTEQEGLSISLKVDVPQTRTRAIDMTPGGALYLNNIWIGVYNERTGMRVISDSVNLNSRLTESGVILKNFIKISVNQADGNNFNVSDKYCIVGVANYYGIKTTYTDNTKTDLIDALESADTWEKFYDISLDAQQDIPTQTPVLMGYLTNSNDESLHTVVYQLPSNTNTKINLRNQTNVFVSGKRGNNGLPEFNTSNFVMNLRRLRSKINIKLTTRDDQMTITNIEYKVVNAPKSSFLAERMTVDDKKYFTSTYSAYSPNSADAKNEGYITLNDAEWQKPTDNYNFSVEHVENKHWAMSTPGNYHERGKQSGGVFTNLASSTGDWNNNASYIILRISLRDFKDGRNSVIDYTIMEGFCNDANGVSQVDEIGNTKGELTTRLQDFSCFRNMDYYYNIHINRVDDIYTTVYSGGAHPDDQHNGNIWQMKYPEFKETGSIKDSRITVPDDATLTFTDPIDCTEDDENNTLDFKDIGFRLAGTFYDVKREEKIPVDLCYNVAHGELDGFSGLWIDPINGVTEYFVDTTNEDSEGNVTGSTALEALNKYLEESPADVKEMLSRFTVNADGENNTNLKITEFIQKLKEKEVTKITGVNVKGIKLYETAEESDGPRNHMIGLYVFDRQRSIEKGDNVKTDDNKDCHYYQIRAIEQYPAYLATATYERIYATYNNNTRIPSEACTTDQINNKHNNVNNGRNMIFSENPDIAFRLIGYYDKNDGSGELNGYYDLCYNFDMNEYPWFNESMPKATYDTRSISKTALTRENIPNELLNGIKIKEGENGTPLTIKQFISRALAGNISSSKDYRFEFTSYGKKYYYNTEDERNKSIRGIYIFDKKNRYKQPVLYDGNNHKATYQIYVAEQDGIYVPPVELPNPDKSNIKYTPTAVYNIIEEYVGEIKVPQLSGYTYNVDYCYHVITQDDNGGSRRECSLEKIKTANNDGTLTFYVPMSIAHADPRNIFIYSFSMNERLLNNHQADYVDKTQSLKKPEWKFSDDEWINIYKGSYFSDYYNKDKLDESQRCFNLTDHEFKSSNFAPITLHSSATDGLRGRIDVGCLYINTSNDDTGVRTKIYKPCKVYITAGPNSSDNIDGKRGISVKCTGNTTQQLIYSKDIPNVLRDEFDYVQVTAGEDNNAELKITVCGGGGNLFEVRLTD